MNSKDAILLTGASGFLGTHVLNELISRGYENIWACGGTRDLVYDVKYSDRINPIHRDLRKEREVNRLFKFSSQIKKLKGVINLAASVGGIGANQKNPGKFMMDSLKIGINLIEAASHNKSMQDGGKFVQIGTVCAYPKYTPVPFKEENLWNGYPEETNAPYGIAKKTLMELTKNYTIQYGKKFRGISLIPVNLYGPGDNFDLESSHVIPALIRKIDNAIDNGDSTVTLWGTGQASREFLFVKDAAKGIVDAFEKYDGLEPINLGTGGEIKIGPLAYMIARKIGYNGILHFDSTKPDGQPRRCLDVSKAKKEFGFEATTTLDKGLDETIKWYMENKQWLTQ